MSLQYSLSYKILVAESCIRRKLYEKFRRKFRIGLPFISFLRNLAFARVEGGHFQHLPEHAVSYIICENVRSLSFLLILMHLKRLDLFTQRHIVVSSAAPLWKLRMTSTNKQQHRHCDPTLTTATWCGPSASFWVKGKNKRWWGRYVDPRGREK